MPQQSKLSLWKQYKNEQDAEKKLEIRNQLIEIYHPLVKRIAKALSEKINRKVLDDELTSYGIDGLYIAIDRYDEERGTKFESFASLRIKGAMYDEIRKMDSVPRSVRMNNRLFEKTKIDLEVEAGRLVSDYEVMKKIGLTEEETISDLRNYKPVNTESLDNTVEDMDELKQDCNINLKDDSIDEPDSHIMRKEFFNKLLGKNFSVLERKVIYMYYYEDLTMDVIAQKINLSESRVSQIHTNLLPRLKEKVLRNPNYFSSDISTFVSSQASSALF